MKLAISQSNYLPWIGYFKLVSKVEHFIFYDQVQYTKNDWRNRNTIILNGAPNWLTIPINYRFSDRLPINQVRLPASNWKDEHLEKISSAYEDQNNFSEYFPNLMRIISNDHEFLSELNQEIVRQYAKVFNIRTNFHATHTIDLNLDRNRRIIEACKDFSARTYVCSPKSLNYIDRGLFEKNGIELEIINFDDCLEGYKQNSRIFDPHVSFLDLLFMTGVDGVARRLR